MLITTKISSLLLGRLVLINQTAPSFKTVFDFYALRSKYNSRTRKLIY